MMEILRPGHILPYTRVCEGCRATMRYDASEIATYDEPTPQGWRVRAVVRCMCGRVQAHDFY